MKLFQKFQKSFPFFVAKFALFELKGLFLLLVWYDGSSNYGSCGWVPHLQKTQRTLHPDGLYFVLPPGLTMCHTGRSIRAEPIWLPVRRCFSSVPGFLWNCNPGLDLWHWQVFSWHWENDRSSSRSLVVVLLEVLCTSHHGRNLLVQCIAMGWYLLWWL